MENKQTAVEWLYSQITFNGLDDPDGEVLEQAKALEKEQIKEAYKIAIEHQLDRSVSPNSEKYYNETYKQ